MLWSEGAKKVAFSVLRFSVCKFSCCICLRCAFFTPFSNDSKKGDRTGASLFVLFHAVLPINANFLQKTIAKRDKVCYNTVIKN